VAVIEPVWVVDDVEYVLVTKLSFLFLLFTTTCFSVSHN
jgi:hypothetical protein